MQTLSAQGERWLSAALALPDEAEPFPWQRSLLVRHFIEGEIPRALDLPTGLGKTSVMAIWLVARALGAALPRRLVYVVDRRAVVDQATETALGLRRWVDDNPDVATALGLGGAPLPISTLRGQFADNREWLDDPTRPAIIVGTVDMVGSRLLFQGYGTSRKMRPYQAGLLGVDSLFVIDEAHLVPPFEHLIETVTTGEHMGPELTPEIGSPPRLLSLSATGRDHGSKAFRLDDKDRKHKEVSKRLGAAKGVIVAPPCGEKELASALAMRAWELTADSDEARRIIVFSSRRKDAEKAKEAVEKIAKTSGTKIDAQLFVGARRVREREDAKRWLDERGFLAGSTRPQRHAFLFATAAGEVGVDLDADHAVADVVAWERMVQRVGRVNRRGGGEATVHVLPTDATPRDFDPGAVLELIAALPKRNDGARDVSPDGLQRLAESISADESLAQTVLAATTPEPLRPALSRPLLDAWAMTSLRDHSGRPEVGPWLRGWVDDEPNTVVVWRAYLGDLDDGDLPRYLEAAPVHLSERLETRTDLVGAWLLACRERLPAAESNARQRDRFLILDTSGEIVERLRIGDLETSQIGRNRTRRRLAGATIVVDASLGGLSDDGLLDSKVKNPARAADSNPRWSIRLAPTDQAETRDDGSDAVVPLEREPTAAAVADDPKEATHDASVPFRVLERPASHEPPESGDWRERMRLPLKRSGDGDVELWLVVDGYRADASTEEDRSTAPTDQGLQEHQTWAAMYADQIGKRLRLPDPIATALRVAARLHDEGKRAQVWQNAFSAPPKGRPYAKTRGPLNVHRLGKYRHELGSVPYAESDPEVQSLPDPLRDLVLHLITAHHGFSRPTISIQGCEDAPPSMIRLRAQAIARRFVRLSERWGTWGLAYLETLMRSADQQASRAHAEGKEP